MERFEYWADGTDDTIGRKGTVGASIEYTCGEVN